MRPPGNADPTWIRVADRCYGAALLLFSSAHRDEYGPWMRQAFRDRCREVARGERSAFRVLALELAPDLITSLGREHMQASFGNMRPRQIALLGVMCAALTGLLFKDAITPPVLNVVFVARNRINDYLDLRQTQAQEAQLQRIAEHLMVKDDAHAKALAALLYSSIAQRKQSFYQSSDDQNESFYHRPPEDASFENQRVAALVAQVLHGQADAYALTIATYGCHADAGCDIDGLISRLSSIAPLNGQVWTIAYEAAAVTKNQAAMNYAMSRLAQSSHYTTYEGRADKELLTAGRELENGRHDSTNALFALLPHLIESNPLASFHFGAAGWNCLKQQSQASAQNSSDISESMVPANCYRIFELLAGSTQLGVSLAGWKGVASLTNESEIRDRARQQMRDRYWLAGATFDHTEGGLRYEFDRFGSQAERESFIDSLAAGDGEIPSLQRWYVARGLPAHAPSNYYVAPDWLPGE